VKRSSVWEPLPAPERVCTRCVMDSSHREITFDAAGVCNFCRSYDEAIARPKMGPGLATLIAEIKREGRGKPYDCILGLSGGLDSSYLALVAVQNGLRPLAVHLDNGWNSELAVKNIELLCRKLGIDLHTHVIDWEEFRDLQLGFLRAGLANLEAPSDHAIFACLRRTAAQRGIRTILTGVNEATELITVKESYGHRYSDGGLIRSVHRRFCSVPLKTFPLETFWSRWRHRKFARTREVTLLNLIPYRKEEAQQVLERELGWRRYPGKHGESVITRFHQATYLPRKFGLDKRKLHLSNLICSGQLRREQAREALQAPPFPEEVISADREFVAKKFGLAPEELERLLHSSPRSHREFPNDEQLEAFYDRFSSSWLRLREGLRRLVAGGKA
jgi:N-acetyl sugar amidotransferase